MTTDRDAANPAALIAAIAIWLKTEPGDHEADIILESTLLSEGVMAPTDVIESIEGNADADGIVVTFDNMDAYNIDIATGAVTKLEE